jgi:urease accessory protein
LSNLSETLTASIIFLSLVMLTLTQRSTANSEKLVEFTLVLTAEERTRSRHNFTTQEGQAVYLQLPRGTVLTAGDLLTNEAGNPIVQVLAAPEPVLTVTADNELDLLRAAYHLGNRHVALEITTQYLRLAPDPVLKSMLEKLGLHVVEEVVSFQPEMGAYHHHH